MRTRMLDCDGTRDGAKTGFRVHEVTELTHESDVEILTPDTSMRDGLAETKCPKRSDVGSNWPRTSLINT